MRLIPHSNRFTWCPAVDKMSSPELRRRNEAKSIWCFTYFNRWYKIILSAYKTYSVIYLQALESLLAL